MHMRLIPLRCWVAAAWLGFQSGTLTKRPYPSLEGQPGGMKKRLIRIVVGLAGFEPAITWVLGLYGSQAT